MSSFARHAVYYAPPQASALARFGAAWLGHGPAGGEGEPIVAAGDLERAAIDRITTAPRRYGFHGTLKAPFRLADNATIDDLEAAIAAIAASASPVSTDPLELTRLGQFLALCPSGGTGALDALAARIVRELDTLRAPLGADERARRAPDRLSPRQLGNLDRWGYPYVFEDFRFHLSLTGQLDTAGLDSAGAALGPLTAPFAREPFVIEEICLFGDPGDGAPFTLVSRHRLSGRSV